MTDILEIDYDGTETIEIGYVSGGFIPVPGPEGPQGPKGDPGEIEEVTVQFASPSTSWGTTHTFDHHPIVVTLDQSGNEIKGDITWPNATTVQVDWAVPVAGSMRLY